MKRKVNNIKRSDVPVGAIIKSSVSTHSLTVTHVTKKDEKTGKWELEAYRKVPVPIKDNDGNIVDYRLTLMSGESNKNRVRAVAEVEVIVPTDEGPKTLIERHTFFPSINSIQYVMIDEEEAKEEPNLSSVAEV